MALLLEIPHTKKNVVVEEMFLETNNLSKKNSRYRHTIRFKIVLTAAWNFGSIMVPAPTIVGIIISIISSAIISIIVIISTIISIISGIIKYHQYYHSTIISIIELAIVIMLLLLLLFLDRLNQNNHSSYYVSIVSVSHDIVRRICIVSHGITSPLASTITVLSSVSSVLSQCYHQYHQYYHSARVCVSVIMSAHALCAL